MSKAKCPKCGTNAVTEGHTYTLCWLKCILCETESKKIEIAEASTTIADDLPDWFENE